jgi:hypothetical protein
MMGLTVMLVLKVTVMLFVMMVGEDPLASIPK